MSCWGGAGQAGTVQAALQRAPARLSPAALAARPELGVPGGLRENCKSEVAAGKPNVQF